MVMAVLGYGEADGDFAEECGGLVLVLQIRTCAEDEFEFAQGERLAIQQGFVGSTIGIGLGCRNLAMAVATDTVKRDLNARRRQTQGGVENVRRQSAHRHPRLLGLFRLDLRRVCKW